MLTFPTLLNKVDLRKYNNSLVTAIADTDLVGKTLVVTEPVTCGDIIVPNTISLEIVNGGSISVNVGATLSINGPYDSYLGESLIGNVVINGPTKTHSVKNLTELRNYVGYDGASVEIEGSIYNWKSDSSPYVDDDLNIIIPTEGDSGAAWILNNTGVTFTLNDVVTSTVSTWSSSKISTEIDNVVNDIDIVNDVVTSTVSTWSSDKISTEIDNVVNDVVTSTVSTWSSDKISTLSTSTIKKIAVIGDSLSADQKIKFMSWPTRIEQLINNGDENFVVRNFAINAHSFYRANNTITHDGLTAVQAVIDYEPDIVLVALGFNDTITVVDSRTLVQTQSDANILFQSLRTGLPTSTLIYVSEEPYDKVNGVLGSLKNENIHPSTFNRRTTGILANCFCSEILSDVVSSATQTLYSNWNSLDTYIKGLSNVDGSITMSLFRIARLGCLDYDMLHFTFYGVYLQAGYVFKGMETLNLINGLPNQNYEWWNDPDDLYLEAIKLTPNSATKSIFKSLIAGNVIAPVPWYLRNRLKFYYFPVTSRDQPFIWNMYNGEPLSPVYVSVNGAAFSYLDRNTEWDGSASACGIDPMGATGTYIMRYKCGEDIVGPLTLEFIGDPLSSGSGDMLKSVYDPDSNGIIAVAQGGTGASSATTARTNLGITFSPSWFNIALQNGWTNVKTAKCRVDNYGVVKLCGLIKQGGTNTICCTLPVGYRPSDERGFIIPCEGVPVPVIVYPTGVVEIFNSKLNDQVWLDGISFINY